MKTSAIAIRHTIVATTPWTPIANNAWHLSCLVRVQLSSCSIVELQTPIFTVHFCISYIATDDFCTELFSKETEMSLSLEKKFCKEEKKKCTELFAALRSFFNEAFTAWAPVLRVGGAAYWTSAKIFFYLAFFWSHNYTYT